MSQSTKRRWNSGPSTPSSTSKKKKYNCKFQDEWNKSHYWLQSSSLGNDLAFCTLVYMWTKVIPFPPSSLYISYKTIYFPNILMKSFLI